MNTTICIDSREKTHAILHITNHFDKAGIKYYTNKLLVGDYQNLHNPSIIVDRKQSLVEVQNNITQQHERFRNELKLAQENNIKLYILIEEKGINTLEDVKRYKNPRMKQWQFARARALKKGEHFTQRAPLNGNQIYEILNTMQNKYGCTFLFVEKKNFANKLIELLTLEN